jgi:hypothetical protein
LKFKLLIFAAILLTRSSGGISAAPSLNFARDVRPILANNCFHCHGPDAAERKADLRLDVWDSVGKLHGAQAVIDSKTPAESELIRRITSDDPDEHMPPADSGKSLRPEQIGALRQWVNEGALGVCSATTDGCAGCQKSGLGAQPD